MFTTDNYAKKLEKLSDKDTIDSVLESLKGNINYINNIYIYLFILYF